MSYDDAILLLEKQPIENYYTTNQVRSESRGLWLVRSKFGISYCTRDWPAPYHPSDEDKKATDWEIYNPTNEKPTN